MKQTGKSSVKRTIRLLITNYFNHNVGKNAAALAYYLLFALFPILIFTSNLLGIMNLNVHPVTQSLWKFLPTDVASIVETYLDYVSHTSSHTLLWFSLVFSIWFPMRAAQGLMNDVRRAYELDRPTNTISYTVRQLLYTLVLLAVIALTLLLSVLGENVLAYISNILPKNALRLSDYLLTIWQYLRFGLIAVLMLTAIGTLYGMALEKRQPIKKLMPGIVLTLLVWMIVSIGFSFYVENFANYSVIYGTLGAVIVLLIWLYLTAVILILGAELNAALATVQLEKE